MKEGKNPWAGSTDGLATYERERASDKDKSESAEFADAIVRVQRAIGERKEAQAKLDAIRAESNELLSVAETKLAYEACFKEFSWHAKFAPNPVATACRMLQPLRAFQSISSRAVGAGDTGRERWKAVCKLRELYWAAQEAEAEVRRKGAPIAAARGAYPALRDLTEEQVMAVKL